MGVRKIEKKDKPAKRGRSSTDEAPALPEVIGEMNDTAPLMPRAVDTFDDDVIRALFATPDERTPSTSDHCSAIPNTVTHAVQPTQRPAAQARPATTSQLSEVLPSNHLIFITYGYDKTHDSITSRCLLRMGHTTEFCSVKHQPVIPEPKSADDSFFQLYSGTFMPVQGTKNTYAAKSLKPTNFVAHAFLEDVAEEVRGAVVSAGARMIRRATATVVTSVPSRNANGFNMQLTNAFAQQEKEKAGTQADFSLSELLGKELYVWCKNGLKPGASITIGQHGICPNKTKYYLMPGVGGSVTAEKVNKITDEKNEPSHAASSFEFVELDPWSVVGDGGTTLGVLLEEEPHAPMFRCAACGGLAKEVTVCAACWGSGKKAEHAVPVNRAKLTFSVFYREVSSIMFTENIVDDTGGHDPTRLLLRPLFLNWVRRNGTLFIQRAAPIPNVVELLKTFPFDRCVRPSLAAPAVAPPPPPTMGGLQRFFASVLETADEATGVVLLTADDLATVIHKKLPAIVCVQHGQCVVTQRPIPLSVTIDSLDSSVKLIHGVWSSPTFHVRTVLEDEPFVLKEFALMLRAWHL
jgi:hypothetical protein